MANVKISQLSAKTSLSANDVFPIVDTDNSATKKVTAKSVKDYIRPYKVYTALLTQTGENAPVATVLENTIGDIVWARISEGSYEGILANAFTNNKTFILVGANLSDGTSEITFETSAFLSKIFLATYAARLTSDGLLINTPIEIRVYL